MSLFDSIKKNLADAVTDLEKKASEAQKQATAIAADLKIKASEAADSIQKSTQELYSSSSKTIEMMYRNGSYWASDFWNNKVPSTDELEKWAADARDKINGMADDFDAQKMWDKIKSSAAKAGQDLVVMVLTIYYTIAESIKGKK